MVLEGKSYLVSKKERLTSDRYIQKNDVEKDLERLVGNLER